MYIYWFAYTASYFENRTKLSFRNWLSSILIHAVQVGLTPKPIFKGEHKNQACPHCDSGTGSGPRPIPLGALLSME